MEHFPALLTRAESDAFADRIEAHWRTHGFGLWAVEIVDGDPFVGFVGLAVPRFAPPVAHRAEPPVEVGWRLARSAWGQGYATEAGLASVTYALDVLGLPEVLSWTYVGNDRSRRVMERIGLVAGEEFDHPRLAGSPIERHVVYRSAA